MPTRWNLPELRLFAAGALGDPCSYGATRGDSRGGWWRAKRCQFTAFPSRRSPRNERNDLLFAAAIVFWGQRTPGQCLIEAGHPPAEILQLVNEQKGEVLWIDGSAEAWYMLGRPQWATPLQGIPIVLSSALANEWRNRTQSLMSLRLADQKSFDGAILGARTGRNCRGKA
jgi:hypothetical protein